MPVNLETIYAIRRYRRMLYGARIDAAKPSHHARYWPNGTWNRERLHRGLDRFADRIAWRRMLVRGEIMVFIDDLFSDHPVVCMQFEGFPNVHPDDRPALDTAVTDGIDEVIVRAESPPITTAPDWSSD